MVEVALAVLAEKVEMDWLSSMRRSRFPSIINIPMRKAAVMEATVAAVILAVLVALAVLEVMAQEVGTVHSYMLVQVDIMAAMAATVATEAIAIVRKKMQDLEAPPVRVDLEALLVRLCWIKTKKILVHRAQQVWLVKMGNTLSPLALQRGLSSHLRMGGRCLSNR